MSDSTRNYTASLISFLQLKAAAFLDVGNGPGTVAAGDDTRLTSLRSAAFRNVGVAPGTVAAADDNRLTSLKSAAFRDVGTASGTVMAGDDSRVASAGAAAAGALPASGGISTGRQTFQAGIAVSGPSGFFGTQPIAKPIITGSRGMESDASASLRSALVALGLATDNTVA